jgi:hypothetical protein
VGPESIRRHLEDELEQHHNSWTSRTFFVLQNAEYTCSICIPEIAVKADGANHKVSGNKKYDSLAVKQVGDTIVLLRRRRRMGALLRGRAERSIRATPRESRGDNHETNDADSGSTNCSLHCGWHFTHICSGN